MESEHFAWFVVGLLELDGSFALPKLQSGRRVPRLQVMLKEDERVLLEKISAFLRVGKVSLYPAGKGSKGTKPRAHLRIDGKDAVNVLVPFLDRHPFVGPKRQVYERWREVVMILEQGKGVTEAERRFIDELAERVNDRN
jgi:hypothetical protein